MSELVNFFHFVLDFCSRARQSLSRSTEHVFRPSYLSMESSSTDLLCDAVYHEPVLFLRYHGFSPSSTDNGTCFLRKTIHDIFIVSRLSCFRISPCLETIRARSLGIKIRERRSVFSFFLSPPVVIPSQRIFEGHKVRSYLRYACFTIYA